MTKSTLLYISAFLLLAVGGSCKKELKAEGAAGLTIINAIPDCPRAAISLNSTYVPNSSGYLIDYGVYTTDYHIGIQAKETPFSFDIWPNPNPKDKPAYQTTLHPAVGDISTLFMVGTLANPETFLVTKTPPFYGLQDSLMGIRLVNLASDLASVRVKITGQSINTGSDNLAYKGITDYIQIAATAKVGNVLVEFFDRASGSLISTFTLQNVGATLTDNAWRYRNYTLALKKGPDTANPNALYTAFLIDDFF